MEPVYTTFLTCVEEKTLTGIEILESQAGYIELPEFERGSSYMPFSSQLNFLGNPIPYWYYVSKSNIEKEQVPTEQDMEESLGDFIEERITECDFGNYYPQGFEITQGEPTADVNINSNNIDVKLNMNLDITRGEENAFIETHEVNVKSSLGALYSSAKKIYEKEQRELFLENYGVETLRLYAPVDGVQMSCSPKTWNADEVFDDLQEMIETTTLLLRTENPSDVNEKHFFIDAGVSEGVRFLNSRNWSNSFEVNPSQESLLIATPVGNQPGLGILGFCYVSYHFVYNVKYPVLVQVYNGNEVFQFPIAVVIQGNKPRKALNSTAKIATTNLCSYKNTPATITTYDTNLNPVNSFISYECFGESCDMGRTSSGTLTTDFPQCTNGYIVARADGFNEKRYLYSTTQEGTAQIILDKLYGINVELKLGGADYNGNAIIYFISDDNSRIVSYPEQKKVNLSEGPYEVSVYVYRDSSIQLPEATSRQCVDVPSSGIGGLFGAKEQNCFDVKTPSQLVSNVLAGGGTQDYSITEEELKNSNTLEIKADSFPIPKTIEEFQNNYQIFEEKGLELNFR